MADAMNGQVAKIVECLLASIGADALIQVIAPEYLGDLDVDQLRGVKIGFFDQNLLHGLGFWCVKQPFEHGGGVEHDHRATSLVTFSRPVAMRAAIRVTGGHRARLARRRQGIPAVRSSGGFARAGAIPAE